jgi:hypothetical protein
MASAPANALPLYYQDLQPLSSSLHAKWKARNVGQAKFFAQSNAIPLTIEEFVLSQRHYPIVFSSGNDPVPLALMGLNEGVNVFTDEDGKLHQDIYVPAYVRRYPYMLARLRPDSEEMSLCFDPTSGVLGDFEEGEPLFDGTEPTDQVKTALDFCERFEQAGQRTGLFVQELIQNKLLIDGEISIQPDGAAQPFVYRGFQMVSEERLRDLRGDVLRKMVQSGMLPLIFAHLFSLNWMQDIFGLQMQQGKIPVQLPDPVA